MVDILAAVTISENWAIFLVGLIMTGFGFFITRTLSKLDDSIRTLNNTISGHSNTITAMDTEMKSLKERTTVWHNDKNSLFQNIKEFIGKYEGRLQTLEAIIKDKQSADVNGVIAKEIVEIQHKRRADNGGVEL